jgi:hypothetical protein
MSHSQRLPIMGGKDSCDKSDGKPVRWRIQSRTAVLRKTFLPRHDISDAVALRVVAA